jgi:outer membrane protein TolC
VDYLESWQRGDNPVFVFSSLLMQQRFSAANFDIATLNNPSPLVNYRGAFAVEQPVFDSARLAALRSARLGRQIAAEDVRELASALAVATARAFGDSLQAAANRAAAEAAVQSAREDLGRAERRRDVGLITDADVLSLKVHLAQVQEREIRSASALAIARSQLNRLMGVPLDQKATLEEPVPSVAAVPALDESEKQALTDRGAIKRASLRVAQAEVGQSAARWTFVPQVAVQGVYEFNGNQFTNRASSWVVGLQARWNLFAGLGDRARLRAAAEYRARAAAERESAETAVRLEVRTARAQLEGAVAREAVGRALVMQARESQRIIRDRYEAGLVGVSDVLRAANAVLDAESQRIAAVVDVMVGQAVLDGTMGRVPGQ